MQPTGTTARPLTALVACRVLEAEIGALAGQATHIVRREFFEIGLHDQPTNLRGKLAAAIERAENDPAIETVVVERLLPLAPTEAASNKEGDQ